MTVLVVYASRHGATEGIAARIATRIARSGAAIDLRRVDEVDALDAYDAVVFGAPVYDQSWPPEADAFVTEHSEALAARPLWLFSVGSFGDTKRLIGPVMRKEPKNIAQVRAAICPREYRVFQGVIQKHQWPFWSRVFFHAFGGRFGDHRNWPVIEAWADQVALNCPLCVRRHPCDAVAVAATPDATGYGGWVAPGFEEVRDEFERNFAERGEVGAAVAAYWRGDKVVDLWGGRRTPTGDEPWNEDTLVVVNSTTKGLAAMTVAVANSRGWIDYEAPVAEYWPDFAQNGKGAITVRQLLSHEAGLVWIDEPLQPEDMRDLDRVAGALARQKPAWEPGTRHGYHAMTIGLYMQELIRHVDPAHRTLGRFFQEEIAEPLEIEFYIGLPPEIPDERLAQLMLFSPMRAIRALPSVPKGYVIRIVWPWSLLRKSMLFADMDPNDRGVLDIEIPAGNGVGTARAIARAYSAFAEGGAELGISPATLATLTAIHDPEPARDEIVGVPSWLSLGFLRPGPEVDWGTSRRAFGTPGAGGSFGFADPDARLGFAYVMNKMDFQMFDDPREKALRDAVHRSIRKLSG